MVIVTRKLAATLITSVNSEMMENIEARNQFNFELTNVFLITYGSGCGELEHFRRNKN